MNYPLDAHLKHILHAHSSSVSMLIFNPMQQFSLNDSFRRYEPRDYFRRRDINVAQLDLKIRTRIDDRRKGSSAGLKRSLECLPLVMNA